MTTKTLHSAAWGILLLLISTVANNAAIAADVPPITAAADLAELLKKEGTVLLDIRSQDDYAKEHIPGARWIDSEGWRNKTFEATGLADKDYWQTELRSLGVNATDQVIIVGQSMPETSRAWWLLKYLGLKRVQVLDGGYAAWTNAGLPVDSGATPAIEPSDINVEMQSQMVAVLEDLMPDALTASKARVLDNRSPAEFTGARGVGARTGHIPGSVHLEWTKLLDKDGKFLPKEQIAELLKEQGVDPDEPIVTVCQTAGRSSVAALALEIVGAKDVKNYYRGWGEYAGALSAPVEKGEQIKNANE